MGARQRSSVAARPRPATVLVAVGSAQVREALACLIGAFDGFRVVGEAGSDEQALAIAGADSPRIAVVDDDLPGCDLGSTIEALREQGLAQAIVAIGSRAGGAARAQAAGACAYLQIGASPAEILSALTAALEK